MTGLTNAESAAMLDARYPAGATSDAWAWSADGLTETGGPGAHGGRVMGGGDRR
jgi:hypothetical protein